MSKLLDAQGLTKRFGGVYALKNVSVSQLQGETLGVIGPNGSGKSSLVNAVTGHLAVQSGTVLFAGQNITGKRPHQVAEIGLTRTFQAARVYRSLTVRRNLQIACMMLAKEPGRAFGQDAFDALLEWLSITPLINTKAGSLTLFEQRRLELAMRLVLSPKLVMLDEPVGGLAPNETRQMIKLLREMKQRCDIFVIEHTMHVIRELADRVVVLITGEKVADGPPAEILKDRLVLEKYLGTANA